MKLPTPATTIETLHAKTEAIDTVERLLNENKDMREIFNALQPLLYELSVFLYKDNDEDIALSKLVEDGVEYLKSKNEGAH